MIILDCEPKTDEELVALAVSNPDFFACLVKKYEPSLRRYSRRLIGQRDDEDDLLQDVFLKCYLNLNDFDQNLKFSSWLYRITHNHLVDYLKNKSRLEFTGEEAEKFLQKIDGGEDSSSLAKQNEASHLVDKILEKLDDKSREILILRFLEDKSYEEISDILKAPLGTVAARLNRAKLKFKKATLNK